MRDSRAIRRKRDHAVRRAEKARLKHDKFVTPQGPQPVKLTREPKPPEPDKPRPEPQPEPITIDDPNERWVAGEWLKGDGETVLYEQSEFYGEFNFRDSILDQLDRYWVYLERMKRYDPDAYGFYKQLGATLVPYAATQSYSDKPEPLLKIKDKERYKREIELTPWFKQHWPAFGCIAFGTNPRDEAVETIKIDGNYISCPKFMYFTRLIAFPWTVQPVRSGKFYMLTVWWDRVEKVDGHRYKWGRPQEFPIHISDDGSRIRILKTRQKGNGNIRADWDWRIPHSYKEWSKIYGLDPQTHLGHLFCNAVREIEYATYSMLRVEVSNGDLTAVFGLSPRRTAYFFQDRDIALTEGGGRKKVFHMVKGYTRKDGGTVPWHFRGEREFTWAGYKVRITVPGRDHLLPQEVSVPAIYRTKRDRLTKGYISEAEVARQIKDRMRRGEGGTA